MYTVELLLAGNVLLFIYFLISDADSNSNWFSIFCNGLLFWGTLLTISSVGCIVAEWII